MMGTAHSNKLESSTSPAENPSTGLFVKSAQLSFILQQVQNSGDSSLSLEKPNLSTASAKVGTPDP